MNSFNITCISGLAIIFSVYMASCGSDLQKNPQIEWELIWSDEFSGEGLPDPDKWSYEVGYIRNHEAQYYTEAREENIRMEDGVLIIEARKEPYEEFEYTSASINTRESAAWTYGRFEVKAKLPTGTGTWPAIWMLGANINEVGWPACGEIDIMENVGFDPYRVHGYVHTEAYNHTKGTQRGASLKLEAPYDQFHVYAIEWFENRIDFFIDDEKYFTFENEGEGDHVWPFDKPHYLLLNLAIGGAWGGQQGIDDSIFPQQYKIDYVRVYQQAES